MNKCKHHFIPLKLSKEGLVCVKCGKEKITFEYKKTKKMTPQEIIVEDYLISFLEFIEFKDNTIEIKNKPELVKQFLKNS